MATKQIRDLNLFELEAEFKDLDDACQALAEELGAEESPSPEQEAALRFIQAREAELEGAFQKKAEGWGRLYLLHRRLAEPVAAEIKRLQGVKRHHERVAERVKDTLFGVMTRLGIQRVDAGLVPLRLQQNGGNPKVEHDGRTPVPVELAAPVPVDPAALLAGFWIAYRRVQSCGEEVPPEDLLAYLGVDTSHLAHDTSKVLQHLEQTGEVPCGFKIERGKHLRIG